MAHTKMLEAYPKDLGNIDKEKLESPRVWWRLGYLEPAPVGTGVST